MLSRDNDVCGVANYVIKEKRVQMYACAGHGDTVSGRKRQNGGVECANMRLVGSNPRIVNATFLRHSSHLYIKITCMSL